MISSYQGSTPELWETVFVVGGGRITGEVTIGKNSSTWYSAVIRGIVNFIKSGERANVQDNSVMQVTNKKHPTFVASNGTNGHAAMTRWVLHWKLLFDRNGSYIIG